MHWFPSPNSSPGIRSSLSAQELTSAAEVLLPSVGAVAAVATGLLAGLYLAFSILVLPALRAQPPAQALTTLQCVNERAERPLFLSLFFGGALAALAVMLLSQTGADPGPGWVLRALGAGLALVSAGITLGRNVPLNRAMARLSPGTQESDSAVPALLRSWSGANHARTVAAVLGCAALVASRSFG